MTRPTGEKEEGYMDIHSIFARRLVFMGNVNLFGGDDERRIAREFE